MLRALLLSSLLLTSTDQLFAQQRGLPEHDPSKIYFYTRLNVSYAKVVGDELELFLIVRGRIPDPGQAPEFHLSLLKPKLNLVTARTVSGRPVPLRELKQRLTKRTPVILNTAAAGPLLSLLDKDVLMVDVEGNLYEVGKAPFVGPADIEALQLPAESIEQSPPPDPVLDNN